jgi:RNA polymerase sigma-70 factor (ECF subfamily)
MRGTEFENDTAAAHAIRQGNMDGLAYLYRQYSAPLYRFLYPYCNNRELSQEIAQDAFLKLWEKRKLLDPGKEVRNLLFTIARNLLTDQLRKQKLEKGFIQTNTPVTEPMDDTAFRQIAIGDYQHKVLMAMQQLPTRCRQVYLLSRREQLTHPEIASALSISVKAVEKHVHKASKFLRNLVRIK